jgi:hypothetical protein
MSLHCLRDRLQYFGQRGMKPLAASATSVAIRGQQGVNQIFKVPLTREGGQHEQVERH